jgi:arginyl-tRNA synthetase
MVDNSMLPHRTLEDRLQQAVKAVLPDVDASSVQVRPCADPKHGDYQSNALMSLAKARKINPRQLAGEVAARLDLSDLSEPVEIAGPGFLNFRLKTSALATAVEQAAQGQHLFFEKTTRPRTIVIDFSSPNVAKPMHVGHIRSTILGDSLARLFRLLGHQVITDNHLGDWGTQFGMLLLGWKQQLNSAALEADPIAEMERLYKSVHAASENAPAVREQARQELVKLQAGDEENLEIWRKMIALSQVQFDKIYGRLGVKFDHTLGESFYNPQLQPIVDELIQKGMARESEGATVIFFDDIPALKNTPALIRKSDGAFNYTTTDLATLSYRLKTWQPGEILYVTDGRQQLHFQQLFTIFRRWHPDDTTKLAHIWFGSILGEDGKPFKTRSGETIRLSDLLDEAEQRAFKVVSELRPELPEPQRKEIARVVGLGAIKYADLLPNRQSDYVFSWEKMLALNGNSGPYLQMAYVRTRSLLRKAAEQGIPVASLPTATKISFSEEAEVVLAKALLKFGLVLEGAAEEYRPNFICNYLYDLAGLYSQFWEQCPVLEAKTPIQRDSRLVLSDLTGRVLRAGLEVLGIEPLEQM